VSIHLVSTAARLKLKPSEKLILLCLADNARDPHARRALPGLDELMLWGCVSRPRVFAVLTVLEELLLIAQVQRGQKYKRAEFVVFPDGCCEVHGPVSVSCGRDADEPVDSRVSETLTPAQGLALVAQGLDSEGSGYCGRDPLRNQLPESESPMGLVPAATHLRAANQ
jgi:hypothetical protein